ncbi:MAG: YggS family pyridoxal phosphate-dependent enzyme [Myxococcales bacterium]|nr:YggS family pyridoxal phosphate-dependent enzyme [Myxococcota bacterium]MDW8280138.1 YggS family pyridoxal phosphate-dependent enzyme [Myxococcales bacterium]
MESVAELAGRLAAVRAAVQAACVRAGRDPASVTLVAVSKGQPVAALAAALSLGQRDLGENYAQELRDKARALAAQGPRWHFVGTLQRNKVHLVVGTATLIHTVDSVPLAEALAARARRVLPGGQACLVEVNVAAEAHKGGCPPEQLGTLLDAISAQGGALRCLGLMCIPPPCSDPEASRPHFRQLRALLEAERSRQRPHVELNELSMGMSRDFAVAIEEGATLVRIGTAVFGPRPHKGNMV